MNWIIRYRLKLYINNSMWILPVISIVAGLLSVALLNRIEAALGWNMNLSAETGRSVMGTIASSMFSLVVIGSSTVLVAVQLASAQLTPRLIALIYRNPMKKACISVFVFTFTFSVGALVRIGNTVPFITGYVAAYGFLINIALFLYFIDSMGKTLRPSSVVRSVALAARGVIRDVYPRKLGEGPSPSPRAIADWHAEHHRVVLNRSDGVILAFDLKGLVTRAESSNCIIELVPEIGDFAADGTPLFRIYEGGDDLDDDELRRMVAVGQERTLEQDPMFAFRIIVDIASKALSPAINDPTTAVLAIDQIHHLLRDIGLRQLSDGREEDSRGRLRLMYRTPSWEQIVRLSTTEIRLYGRDSIQVMRRLRAMLENLIETLPAHRVPLLEQELSRLRSSSRRMFAEVDDQILTDTGDLQGMGGGPAELPTTVPARAT